MSRLFNDAGSEYLNRGDTLGISGYPFTMACWFNVDVAINQTLMCFGDTNAGNLNRLALRDPADTDVICHTISSAFSATSASYSVDTWHHACAVFAGEQDRSVYLDGGSKGTNVDDDASFGTPDNFTIGARKYNSAVSTYLSGNVAEAAVWNVALTDDDVAILAAGFSPLFVKPANLVGYWPLLRNR